MTIDLNERLRQAADEGTAGLRLDHPATVPVGSGGHDHRRRRLVTLTLAVASAAAVIAAVVVLVGRPAEVRTGPGAATGAGTTAQRATETLEALRSAPWTAEFVSEEGTVTAAHETPDRYRAVTVDPDGVEVYSHVAIGGVLYTHAAGSGDRWQRSTGIPGVPFIERFITTLGALTCWEAAGDDRLVADVSCGTADAETLVGSASITFSGGRPATLDYQWREPGENGRISVRFDPDDVPTITAPDPSLVTDLSGEPTVPTTSAGPANPTGVGYQLPAVPGPLFEIDQSGLPTLLIVMAPWSPHCVTYSEQLMAMAEAGDLPADLQLIVVMTSTAQSSKEPVIDVEALRDAGVTVVDDEPRVDMSFPILDAFSVTNIPTFVAADPSGRIVAREEGGTVDLATMIDAAVATA